MRTIKAVRTSLFLLSTVSLVSAAFAAGFVLAACEDATPVSPSSSSSSSSSGSTGDADVTDDDAHANDGGASKDTGTTKDGSKSDASDGAISGEALKITDGQGRFTARSLTDYTCPDIPGLGLVLQWIIPEDIRVAVNLPVGSYHLQVEGAGQDNVIIVGPDKNYFKGSQPILITQKGTLPETVLTAVTPATGTVTVEGKWSCPQ